MVRAWLTNEELPDGYERFEIALPSGEGWSAQFLGALSLLIETRNFEGFGALTPEENASVWFDVVLEFLRGERLMFPGMVIASASEDIPFGWLLCDGQEVSRVEYAELFSAIGTVYGVGDGETTFNLPQMVERVVAGHNPGGGPFGAFGGALGDSFHSLTVGEMPSHTHVQNAHTHVQNAHTHVQNAHNHSATFSALAAAGSGASLISSVVATQQAVANATPTNQNATPTNQNATPTNQNAGGGQAHDNIQKTIVFNWLIKY